MSGQYAHDVVNRLGRMNAGLVAAQLITTRSFNMKVTFKQQIKEMSAEDLVHWLGENCPNDFDIIEEGGGTTTLIFSVREEEESA